MASIIPGFEYDIFISYRQKDNKGDRWVSQFVEALKTELESTFKEEISVYFDINPHDGLLETHDVDASLKEKLKCLIFIPIISRTYCDPKSFAWEHEFKAFVEMASKDQFGLKVKLPNGNVASRILPVRIHDLEKEDVDLCESIIDGHLRSIEFIYKSSGVNRPIKPVEEKLADNLYKISYRDQINKVCLAIREIIIGLKNPTNDSKRISSPFKKELVNQKRVERNVFNSVWLSYSVLALIVFTTVIFFSSGILKKGNANEGNTVVVILPFQNLTGNVKLNEWQEGIQSELITNSPVSSTDLIFKPAITVNEIIKDKGITDYSRLSLTTAKKISRRLDANVFVYGNLTESETIMRLNAEIVDCRSGDMLQSFKEEGPSNGSIYTITERLGSRIRNFLVISKLKEDIYIAPEKDGASNDPIAYEYFTFGQKAFLERDYTLAIKLFEKAVRLDSNLIYATLHIGWAYANDSKSSSKVDSARFWVNKVWRRRESLPLNQRTYTEFVHERFFGTPDQEILYLKQLEEMDKEWPGVHYNLANAYYRLKKFDLAVKECEILFKIYKEKGIKPMWPSDYLYFMSYYLHAEKYSKGIKLYSSAERDFPNDPRILAMNASLLLAEGNAKKGEKFIEKCRMASSDVNEAGIEVRVGSIYSRAGKLDKAEEYYRRALILHPTSNGLLYISDFFIDNSFKIEEGIAIADSVLRHDPENFEALDGKGRGLYKLGLYKEAYDVLSRSWNLRIKHGLYDVDAKAYIDSARMALKNMNLNTKDGQSDHLQLN